jgi:FecR protein
MQDSKQPKFKKFYVEWWNIKKSTIYGTIALIFLVAGLAFGSWYAYRNNWFAPQEITEAPADAGRLISFEGDVRIIRADTRETVLITKVTYVLAGDTIQTQNDGRATIQMIDGSTLQIRPNSTVVIRDSSSIFGGKNVRVALDQGQLNVKTQDQTENTQNVVEVMESENRLLPQTDASFNTNPATNGGEIRISRGGVETSVGGGEKTIIKENEFASVNNGKIASREKLLASPKLDSPENSAQVNAGSSGAIMTFRWQPPDSNSALKYQLQISKSPYFSPDTLLFERGSVVNTNFTIGDIPPGTFYWRVRTAAVSGQASDWSEPWKFIAVKREGNQPIPASDWKSESVGGNVYRIGGITQPGATVRTQGRETFAKGDGSFTLQVSSSLAQTVVEIGDDKGNKSTYALNLRTGTAVRQ